MKERDEQAILRAETAKQLLENPLMQEALMSIRAKWFDDFCRSKWMQKRLRERLHMQLKACDAFEMVLKNEIASGKLALERMKQQEKGR